MVDENIRLHHEWTLGKPKSEASERVVPLALEATRAAAEWEPFTQNHDPQYWKALREAYMQGYISGSHAEEKRHNIRS